MKTSGWLDDFVVFLVVVIVVVVVVVFSDQFLDFFLCWRPDNHNKSDRNSDKTGPQLSPFQSIDDACGQCQSFSSCLSLGIDFCGICWPYKSGATYPSNGGGSIGLLYSLGYGVTGFGFGGIKIWICGHFILLYLDFVVVSVGRSCWRWRVVAVVGKRFGKNSGLVTFLWW